MSPLRIHHDLIRRTVRSVLAGGLIILFAVGNPWVRANEPESSSTVPIGTLEDANDLLMEGHYDEAEKAYKSLVGVARIAERANLGLARYRLHTGQYRTAIGRLDADVKGDTYEKRLLLAELNRRIGQYDNTLRQARRAIELDRDSAGAHRVLAETLEMLGRRDEAIEAYRWFGGQLVDRGDLPRDATWLTDMAVGLVRSSELSRTDLRRNTAFALEELLRTAYERLDRGYWPARIAAADLLRQRYNNDERDGSVSDYLSALRINERLSEAHTGLGEVALEVWDFEEVERRVEAALASNSQFAPALHLRARSLITQRKYEAARATCEFVLAFNPNDLTALSLATAAEACRYDRAAVTRVTERIAAINPRCALLHRTVGDALGGIRQYEDAEREYLRAIELDPTDANVRTELGMLYMQWGREDLARNALDVAWTLDSFNERTQFTLELLEQLQKMDRFETEHAIVRYDARHDPGLGELIGTYMEEVYDQVTGDFDTELSEKTIVEVFPTMRAFAVRITGKPWIHTVGASTGRVIALASPRDPANTIRYHIADVIKHEFTHTVTLAATRNRIPHWFTEGLAVLEEDSRRSFQWMGLLADAVRGGRLFTLESINWGFVRPERPTDRQLAYAQSEWMCEYIIERFGYDVLNEMLVSFKHGKTQRHVFAEHFGLEPEAFDHAFRSWARDQVMEWGFDPAPLDDPATLRREVEADPENASIIGRLARAELAGGNADRALFAARRALELDSDQREALAALGGVLTAYAVATNDDSAARAFDEEANAALQRLHRLDPVGWTAPKLLAGIALRAGRMEDAITWYARLQTLCPADPAGPRGLAGIYLQGLQYDRALPHLVELAKLEQTDPAVAAQIASVHERRNRPQEARYWYQQAIYIDPYDIPAHRALAEIASRTGDKRTALREFTLLTKLEPDRALNFERAAQAAHEAGDSTLARFFAKEAVRLDPDSSARSFIP